VSCAQRIELDDHLEKPRHRAIEGMLSPLKSAAMQSGQTNHPSQDEVGLDVSHHIHLSLGGEGKYFFLDILFHSAA
jgi:hypothetical protein